MGGKDYKSREPKKFGVSGGADMDLNCATHIPEYWSADRQREVLAALGPIVEEAPFFRPRMPRTGRPWSVVMTNAGRLGWVSDAAGYRYQKTHPETGKPWPAMPDMLLKAWADITELPAEPECCLVNLYQGPAAKMGLHQDRDELDMGFPVLSFSLGDSARFRIGGKTRRGPTRSVRLNSGDAVVLSGGSRLCFHGIDRIMPGSSTLLDDFIEGGGRLNLTLRRVNPA